MLQQDGPIIRGCVAADDITTDNGPRSVQHLDPGSSRNFHRILHHIIFDNGTGSSHGDNDTLTAVADDVVTDQIARS
ncbi:hypothetical protein D3C73_1619800 [compost metagenome]